MTAIDEVRSKIEKLDQDIISLIAERTDLAEEVLESKKEEHRSINDDTQNQVVLDRAANIATEKNLDSGAVKEIYEILIRMSIERQHELSGEGNLP
ncbi:chorismate mutase [Methanococcoides methylutens]|uniref:Chorismate mutase I n=1 Tax=Methanococcoides methylutens MM1 TaxID=1434104 RepID=A0A0E3X052_METMT|nr:chorismate mutase [Methanococcoides methylutens]AKB85324.1 Chorismate mutase I [Methanococcoides methylutens MM1]